MAALTGWEDSQQDKNLRIIVLRSNTHPTQPPNSHMHHFNRIKQYRNKLKTQHIAQKTKPQAIDNQQGEHANHSQRITLFKVRSIGVAVRKANLNYSPVKKMNPSNIFFKYNDNNRQKILLPKISLCNNRYVKQQL